MNKKIYAGMIAFGIAASFWACGSGEIIKADPQTDGVIGFVDPENPTFGVDVSKVKDNCPECGVAPASSSSSKKTVKKSSSSTMPVVSSSSDGGFIIKSSSSSAPIVYSSSSAPVIPPASSSSTGPASPISDAGTCGPEEAIVERDATVKWTFVQNSAVFSAGLMINSTFEWTTSDASTPSAQVVGLNGRSHEVKYTTSGQHKASLKITTKAGAVYSVNCTPVQVNGAPITGCKCTAADKNPDVSVGAKWTVTGCSSVGADIIGYEWVGATVDPALATSATAALTTKKQIVAPVVNVSNNDNTVLPVQCDTIVSVDASDPDYVIDGTPSGTFTVGPGTYKMVYACKTDAFYQRSIIIDAPNGAVKATVAGKSYTVTANGRAQTYKSTTSNQPIDVEIVSGTAKISCE